MADSVNSKYEARNRKMRSKYTKETGRTLGKRQLSGKGSRRVSFACRFAGMAGSMNKDGKPSNLAMALKKWGFSSKAEARAFCNKNKKRKNGGTNRERKKS